jgi:TolA-binding protein
VSIAVTATTPLPAATTPPSAPHPTESAEVLFERANRARRDGAVDVAIATYRSLVRAYPDSAQAATSHISLGKMLAERGDAAGALREFDAYLRRSENTELREEGMMLRATALGNLGRNDDEKNALRDFLAAYPSSLYAPRAQARLEQLR